MILVLGGTHEGDVLCQWLCEQKIAFRLSVATELGKQIYRHFGEDCEVHRFSETELIDYLKLNNIKAIVDTTHPHAYEVKLVAKNASFNCEIPYLRLDREMMTKDYLHNWQNILNDRLDNYDEMETVVEKLKIAHQDHFKYLITGTKYIQLFYDRFPVECCYFRVMPSLFSMKACTDHLVPIDHIIGIKAPCAPELNRALFEAFDITHFIFKESGTGSATELNLKSLVDTAVKGVMVSASESTNIVLSTKNPIFEQYFSNIESLKQYIMKLGGNYE